MTQIFHYLELHWKLEVIILVFLLQYNCTILLALNVFKYVKYVWLKRLNKCTIINYLSFVFLSAVKMYIKVHLKNQIFFAAFESKDVYVKNYCCLVINKRKSYWKNLFRTRSHISYRFPPTIIVLASLT